MHFLTKTRLIIFKLLLEIRNQTIQTNTSIDRRIACQIELFAIQLKYIDIYFLDILYLDFQSDWFIHLKLFSIISHQFYVLFISQHTQLILRKKLVSIFDMFSSKEQILSPHLIDHCFVDIFIKPFQLVLFHQLLYMGLQNLHFFGLLMQLSNILFHVP